MERREFKFRFFDSKNNKMIYCDWKDYIDYLSKFFIEHDNSLPNAMLTQAVGMKDCNDNDIYEGDIIKIPANKRHPEYIGKVVFVDCGFEINCGGSDWMPLESKNEIIGNIFETPNLFSDKTLS